jgi:3-oxoacyl-(acyl-carrier-protein) synthase
MTTAIEVLNSANYFPSSESEKLSIGISESLAIPDMQNNYLKVGSFTGCNISSALNFKGPVTISGSGLQAIVDACQMVRNQEVQLALALGSSVDLTDALLKTLSSLEFFNDSKSLPEDHLALSPAEGSAGLLIESLPHAKARNAKIFAEIEMHSQTIVNDSSEIPVSGEVVLGKSFGVQRFEQCLKKWAKGDWLDITKNIGWVLNADGINDTVIAALIISQGIIPPSFECGKLRSEEVRKASVVNFTADSSVWHLELSKYDESE